MFLFLNCIAAFIKPSNKGFGFKNLLVNSGCACVPTKNGWSFRSRYSTSFLSGDIPLKINPFVSSLFFNNGLTSYLCLCLSMAIGELYSFLTNVFLSRSAGYSPRRIVAP